MQLFQLPNTPDEVNRVAFSPDGRWLAARTPKGVFQVDPSSGEVRTVWTKDVGYVPLLFNTGLAFTADGSGLMTRPNHDDRFVQVFDLTSVATPSEYRPATYLGAFDTSRDGRTVYAAIERKSRPYGNQIVRWNPDTGRVSTGFAKHGGGTMVNIAVSANENWVAGTNSYEVRVWNIAGGKCPEKAARRFKIAEFGYAPPVALAADGSFVALGGRERLGVWDLRTGEGGQLGLGGYFGGVAFSPVRPVLLHGADADVVATAPATRTELRRLHWGIGRIHSVAFAPDGLRCAAGGDSGRVAVWDFDA